jgi:hypothetical protein
MYGIWQSQFSYSTLSCIVSLWQSQQTQLDIIFSFNFRRFGTHSSNLHQDLHTYYNTSWCGPGVVLNAYRGEARPLDTSRLVTLVPKSHDRILKLMDTSGGAWHAGDPFWCRIASGTLIHQTPLQAGRHRVRSENGRGRRSGFTLHINRYWSTIKSSLQQAINGVFRVTHKPSHRVSWNSTWKAFTGNCLANLIFSHICQ